ncbi:hypothetical protein HRbin40_01402 [bacterium HR40]|nr:hypothetical protein HRbin40_01402 [bacterium HR40]
MTRTAQSHPHAHPTLHEVMELTGIEDPVRASRILATGATFAEIEQAMLWARGAGERLGEEERPLAGRIAAVYDILLEEEETD